MDKLDYIKQWQKDNPDKVKEYKRKNREINGAKYIKNASEKYKSLSEEEKLARTEASNRARKKRMEDPEYAQRIKEQLKDYKIRNKENLKLKRNEKQKRKYQENVAYRLGILLRTGFYKAIKRKMGKKEKSIMEIIGCTQAELISFLEQQFREPMSWANHGEIWEIDHIIPIASFDLTSIEEQKQCFHFSNLQPLFKTTVIAESFGYQEIGNHNKKDAIYVKITKKDN